MGYTTDHEISKQIGVPVFYRCSQCGQPVLYYHQVKGAKKYKSTTTRAGSNEETQRKVAEIQLDAKVKEQRTLLIQDADKGNYRAISLKCKCPHCNKIEDWSRYNPSGLEKWQGIIIFIGLIALIAGLAGWLPWPLFFFFLSTYIQLCIINAIFNGSVSKHVRQMDRKNLPIVAEDVNALKLKVMRAFPGETIRFPE